MNTPTTPHTRYIPLSRRQTQNPTTTTRYLDMRDAGYTCRAPSPLAEEMDRPIAEKHPCTKCGGACYYEPWSRPEPYLSYYPYAVCRDCGHAEEF